MIVSSNNFEFNFDGYISVQRVCTRWRCICFFYDNELNGEILNELFICLITIETCVYRVFIDGGYLGVYRSHTDSVLYFTLAMESILNNPILKNASVVLLAAW